MAGVVNQQVTVDQDEILQGSGKITLDGYELGSYQGGVRINYSQSESWVESEYLLMDVDSEITKVEVTIETELEQAALEKIAAAYGMQTSSVLSGASSKVLEIVPPTSMREVALICQGMSGTDRTKIRTYSFPRVVRVGATQTNLQRGVKQTLPVQFRVLASNGSIGTFTDATL